MKNESSTFSLSILTTYLLVILVFVAGGFLLSLAIQFKEHQVVSSILNTLGVAGIVSISTSLLQRHFSQKAHYKEMRQDMEKNIQSLLKSKFDLLEACSDVGIRHLYPKWSTFCENVLPDHLGSMNKSFIAIGIGLSNLSQLFVGGNHRKIVDQHLKDKKEFTFCTVLPDNAAVTYREDELGVKDSTNSAVKASLGYLRDILRANPDSKFQVKTLERLIPRATILCIDDEVIFFSLYFSSARTPSSWVIETREGDVLFKKIKEDIDHLMKNAKDWPPKP